MLRHNKIGMSNIIGYFFSLSNMPMHDMFKRKICKEKIKSKKIKNTLNMIASVYFRRCGSYRMYFKGDSSHQAVMIVCELKWFSHISNRHNMHTLMQSCDGFFSHTTHFAILDTCAGNNVIWPSRGFTCINVCSLNCFDLLLKYKIG